MRRAFLAAILLTSLAVTVVLASGCGKAASTLGTIHEAAASSSPAPWAKVIELVGSLSAAERGRSSVTVELVGSALRFDLTYGSAPGWGANQARALVAVPRQRREGPGAGRAAPGRREVALARERLDHAQARDHQAPVTRPV